MARHTTTKKEEESVQQIGNKPIENMPEESGSVTEAVMKANKQPEHLGPAKAVAQAKPAPEKQPDIKYYRVLNDKRINGFNGFRGRIRAGKEITSMMYNIGSLRSQGVQLQEIPKEEATTL
jgi:hypothetical protein